MLLAYFRSVKISLLCSVGTLKFAARQLCRASLQLAALLAAPENKIAAAAAAAGPASRLVHIGIPDQLAQGCC